MTEYLLKLRNSSINFFYKNFLIKIFFRIDPEKIHDRFVFVGKILGSNPVSRMITSWLFSYQNKMLQQNILGITFNNPIGLAAGFDKNAELMEIMPDVGFGFEEVGSVTGKPCAGNPKPRLWRLKKSKSLMVNYGLKNDGCHVIAPRLKKKFRIPIGVSIAKTNDISTVEMNEGIKDYAIAYSELIDVADYITINISCPNAYGGCPFTSENYLDALLQKITSISKEKPIFLKLSPDLSEKEIDIIINLSKKFNVSGFVCTNLTKNRNNRAIIDDVIPETGGMSGKIVAKSSDDLIAYLYLKTAASFVIIGCGGVFSAQDAYRKIRLGASLIQLITGMIYEGPQLISEINSGLVRLLKKDGFESIDQAIGVDVISSR